MKGIMVEIRHVFLNILHHVVEIYKLFCENHCVSYSTEQNLRSVESKIKHKILSGKHDAVSCKLFGKFCLISI